MLRRLSLLLLSLLVAALLWLGYYVSRAVVPPMLPAEFSITPGSSLKSVARDLHAAGLINHPWAFVLLGRSLGMAGSIKAGSYLQEGPASPYRLLVKITAGDTQLVRITLVEGWTFRQIRAALEADARVRHDSRGMSDRELLAAIGAGEAHPEGLFFPDTYYSDSGVSDLSVLRRAYHTMQSRLDAAWQGREAGLPYATPYQALIMASVIERETGAADERTRIAAVFINRLRLGMRLQTDPTVIYGMGTRFTGDLRKEDLLNDTPYNTYTRAGLPPTPIASPGEAALQAALHPARTRELYFVAKGAGRHHFSETLDEHNRAVQRYQRGGR